MSKDEARIWDVEVAVIGGGPAGLTTAVALAHAGVATALVAGPPRPSDNRTTALLAGSIDILEMIGVWPRCRADAAPLRVMRIVDDTKRLWRAPEVRFEAGEIGLEAFGWNIENRHLLSALMARASEIATLTRLEDAASSLTIGEDRVEVSLAGGGVVRARLVVGADGRRSLCRTAAGIGTVGWSYPQTALTFNLAHTRPHRDISTEFHTEHGPFTLVPLPGRRSSVVCVVDPQEAERLTALHGAPLAEELEHRAHSILGKIVVEPGCGVFPLTVATARHFAANRIALVGEAAHVVPPIGAQGLNLGMRDAATLSELVISARRAGQDIGGFELTSRYDRLRRPDVKSRTFAVDLLNRTLLSGFLPLQGARGLGLYLCDHIGPLRRLLMREGVGPMPGPRLRHGDRLSSFLTGLFSV